MGDESFSSAGSTSYAGLVDHGAADPRAHRLPTPAPVLATYAPALPLPVSKRQHLKKT